MSSRYRLADVAFAALLAVVVAGRAYVLMPLAVPPGPDGGNWLALGHSMLGEHIRSSSVVYPPVVPFLVLGLVNLAGPILGFKLVALIAGTVPATAAYLLLRSEGLGLWAVGTAILLGPASSTGEAMAWGGYPQLIALGALLLFLWALELFMQHASAWSALRTGLLLAFALATNDLIGGAAILCGATLILLRLAVPVSSRLRTRSFLLGLGLVILPSLPLVSLYVDLGREVAASMANRAGAGRLSLSELPPTVMFLFRELPTVGQSTLLVALLAPVALLTMRKSKLWSISIAILLPSVLLLLSLREVRFIYLLPPMLVISLGSWWLYFAALPRDQWTKWLSRSAAAALTLFVVMEMVQGLTFFPAQASYYTVLAPGSVQALDWLQRQTPTEALIVVSPTREDVPFGWWVEGLARRRTLYGSDPAWLYLNDERERAARVAFILDPRAGVTESRRRAAEAGASYILVVKDWPGFTVWASDARGLSPSSIVIDNDTALLLRTGV